MWKMPRVNLKKCIKLTKYFEFAEGTAGKIKVIAK